MGFEMIFLIDLPTQQSTMMSLASFVHPISSGNISSSQICAYPSYHSSHTRHGQVMEMTHLG